MKFKPCWSARLNILCFFFPFSTNLPTPTLSFCCVSQVNRIIFHVTIHLLWHVFSFFLFFFLLLLKWLESKLLKLILEQEIIKCYLAKILSNFLAFESKNEGSFLLKARLVLKNVNEMKPLSFSSTLLESWRKMGCKTLRSNSLGVNNSGSRRHYQAVHQPSASISQEMILIWPVHMLHLFQIWFMPGSLDKWKRIINHPLINTTSRCIYEEILLH